MHWKHLHKYALRNEDLSSLARHRIMMGMFHALDWATPDHRCSSCNGKGYKTLHLPSTYCMSCPGTGQIIRPNTYLVCGISCPGVQHLAERPDRVVARSSVACG